MATRKDLDIWVGNDQALSFKFWADADKTVDFDLTGSEIVFRATWETDGEFRKTSADGGIVIGDATTGEFSIPISHAESRQFPDGKKARYEIERRISGDERTMLYGYLIVTNWGGNDDE